jgi:hypothetical protein
VRDGIEVTFQVRVIDLRPSRLEVLPDRSEDVLRPNPVDPAGFTPLAVAMPKVQERRDKVTVPGGLKLHQYANMYFHARNPMLYKRKEEAHNLCILRISTKARHIPGAVLADQNAASPMVRFLSIDQASELKLEMIYAADWRHPDNQMAYERHRRLKCAEFLVPHQLPPQYIVGAYVVNDASAKNLTQIGFGLPIMVDPELFFQ